MMRVLVIFLFIFSAPSLHARNVQVETSHFPVVQDMENFVFLELSQADTVVFINGSPVKITQKSGKSGFAYVPGQNRIVKVETESRTLRIELPNKPIPAPWSVVPPLIAILLALLFREVLSSLVLGIYSGTAIIGFYTHGIKGLFTGWLDIVDHFLPTSVVPDPVDNVISRSHISVIVFSFLIGGLVSVISQNGGMMAVVRKMSKWANNARNGQLVTWFLGIIIFFDDYANTLIVGNTMRPVTDRLKISREKLSYLVDSTAAPVAALAFITTWIGAELDYIQSGISKIPEIKMGAYSVFLNSLQYAFYPILTIIFMLLIILMRKDFGPMFKAEYAARRSSPPTPREEPGDIDHVSLQKENMWLALIPVAIIVLGTILGLMITGYSPEIWKQTDQSFFGKLSQIVGASDSYKALLWSSFTGLGVSVLLSLGNKIAPLHKIMDWVLEGFKNMLGAILILVLAWSLALVTDSLNTSGFLSGWISGKVEPMWFPALVFLLSSLVSFSTGSSWSTMAILYPILLPGSWEVCQSSGLDYESSIQIFFNTVACVLSGSVLGDHCSPISDTTILSSLASDCKHVDHVRTQLPYALVVGGVSVLLGTLASTLGLPFFVSFSMAVLTLYLIISYFGKNPELPAKEAAN